MFIICINWYKSTGIKQLVYTIFIWHIYTQHESIAYVPIKEWLTIRIPYADAWKKPTPNTTEHFCTIILHMCIEI